MQMEANEQKEMKANERQRNTIEGLELFCQFGRPEYWFRTESGNSTCATRAGSFEMPGRN